MPLTEDVVVRRKVSVRAQATEERRRQILAAAADAFATTGYNATSLRDVAGRAGLSHTGLLHHFPDKPGLLEAVLDDQIQRAAEAFPLESEDGETFLRALVAIAERDVDSTHRGPPVRHAVRGGLDPRPPGPRLHGRLVLPGSGCA